MTTYAATFRELVIPDLRRLCATEAAYVAAGTQSFSDAFAAVFSEAGRRGAMHLPEVVREQLEDWIATTLLQGTVDAETRGEAFRRWLLEREPWLTT